MSLTINYIVENYDPRFQGMLYPNSIISSKDVQTLQELGYTIRSKDGNIYVSKNKL